VAVGGDATAEQQRRPEQPRPARAPDRARRSQAFGAAGRRDRRCLGVGAGTTELAAGLELGADPQQRLSRRRRHGAELAGLAFGAGIGELVLAEREQRRQRRQQLLGTREPVGGPARDAAREQQQHRRAQRRALRSEAREVLFLHAPRHHRERRPVDAVFAGQHEVEHRAERPDVGARTDVGAVPLFGRHVLRRAHHPRREAETVIARAMRLGEAQIRDLDPPLE
jgi:hypothetical protein